MEDEPVRITYQAMMGRINQAANMFHDLGAGRKDAVSFLLPLLPQTQFTLWGAEAAGIANPGLFFGAMAIGMVACRALGSNLINRYQPRNLIATLITGTVIGVLLIACSRTLTMFILAGLILGGANAFMMPTLMDVAVRRSGSSSNAAVATFMGLSDLGMALGPTIMGVLANSFGYSTIFFCVALTWALNLLYSSAVLKEREQR